MRIVVKSAADEFVLCGGMDASEFTEDLQIDQQEQVEPGYFLRAKKCKQFARGNTETSISFVITRQHADIRTCEEYILAHAASVPKTGDVQFIAEGANGNSTKKLSDAQFKGCSHKQIGCASIHTYRFIGGDFEAVTA
jgi:hypothetical protein